MRYVFYVVDAGGCVDDSAVRPYRRPHAVTDESTHGRSAEWKKKQTANKPRPDIDTESIALRIKGMYSKDLQIFEAVTTHSLIQ